jgi:hypothetical protein
MLHQQKSYLYRVSHTTAAVPLATNISHRIYSDIEPSQASLIIIGWIQQFESLSCMADTGWKICICISPLPGIVGS